EEMKRERASLLLANLALLNERTEPVRFSTGQNTLEIESQRFSPVESHVVMLKPGELTRVSVSFRVHRAARESTSGVIKIDGVEGDPAPAQFSIPFSPAEED